MNKDYIEENLKNAVTKITPDNYESIASRCPFPENTQSIPQAKSKKTGGASWIRGMSGVAAALLLLLIGAYWNSNFRTSTMVALDVNPSVSLELNRRNKVLSAQAQNQEGEIILGDMQLKGVDATVAMNALVGSLVKEGYLNEDENSMLVSVSGTGIEAEDTLREQLLHSVREAFAENLFGGAVIGQSLSGKNEEIKALAKEYQVSTGKAALARDLTTQFTNLNMSDAMKLSINDMNLLLSSGNYQLEDVCIQGIASNTAYIENDKVLQQALEISGFSQEEIEYVNVTMGYSGGRVSYEVEFYQDRNKYEYDFDATTGELLEWEQEWKNDELYAIEIDELVRSMRVEGIGQEKALEAAYSHSGIKAEDVIFSEAVPTYEDGMEFYDVDFYTTEYEYEYHIDSTTGEVLEYTHDTKIY